MRRRRAQPSPPWGRGSAASAGSHGAPGASSLCRWRAEASSNPRMPVQGSAPCSVLALFAPRSSILRACGYMRARRLVCLHELGVRALRSIPQGLSRVSLVTNVQCSALQPAVCRRLCFAGRVAGLGAQITWLGNHSVLGALTAGHLANLTIYLIVLRFSTLVYSWLAAGTGWWSGWDLLCA